MNEKEAIDILHNGERMNLTTLLRTFKREGIENFIVTKKEVIEPILNLIEKQQAEIETLKRDFEIIDHECSRLEKEDIRKDRIINEMGYMISAMATGLDTVINQEEEKYCEFKNSSKDCCWKTDKACIDCIREYFNKKIEKGE